MSNALRDMIKKAKAREDTGMPSLEEGIDRFMTVESRNRRNDDGRWHPSQICGGMCPRFEVIERTRPDVVIQKSPPNAGLMQIFWLGTAIHAMYQNDVVGRMGHLWGFWRRVNGWDAEKQIPTWEIHEGFRPDWGTYSYADKGEYIPDRTSCEYIEIGVEAEHNMGGHVDGLLFMGDVSEVPAGLTTAEFIARFRDKIVIFELKSCNSRVFDSLLKPKEIHVKQGQLYMRGLGIKKTLFLYYNKNTSQLKEYVVDYDPTVTAETVTDMIETNEALEKRYLPAKKTECTRANSARAKACRGVRPCMTLGVGTAAVSQLRNYVGLPP